MFTFLKLTILPSCVQLLILTNAPHPFYVDKALMRKSDMRSNSQQGQQKDINRVHDHRHLGDLQLHLLLQCKLGPYPLAERLVVVAWGFHIWRPLCHVGFFCLSHLISRFVPKIIVSRYSAIFDLVWWTSMWVTPDLIVKWGWSFLWRIQYQIEKRWLKWYTIGCVPPDLSEMIGESGEEDDYADEEESEDGKEMWIRVDNCCGYSL